MNIPFIGKGKSPMQKLEEARANLELKMLHTPKAKPKPRDYNIASESTEDYRKRLLRSRDGREL